ncbi:MAG: hypothetical protein U0998_00785 [Moraxellaceae bacterium]|nr:hypothetical protein [Moraxellaceae bacterium]MDZ4385736.1 hypothetical protein [Moraxellaceae bacterium]
MTVFSVCQTQAIASVLLPESEEVASTNVMDCHEQQRGVNQSELTCHSVCNELQQYNDVMSKLSAPEFVPLLLTFLQPFDVLNLKLSAQISYLPPDSFAIDPSPTIRFQRFLN